MSHALASVIATFVTLPLLAFYLIYISIVKLSKNKKYSLKWAVDLSTVLFMIAVYYLAFEIWALSLFWFIIIVVLIVAIIFTLIYWKIADDVHLNKLLKGIWRLNFLVFLVAYFLLSIYGLFVSISSVT